MGLMATVGLLLGRFTTAVALRQVVQVGWKVMLVITIVTVLMIVSRLIPRRTR
jgi:NADH:ubiquinone oxidoreductase subunit H